MHRRTLLKTAGVSMASLVGGVAATSAEGRERAIVDWRQFEYEDDVRIIHELDPVDLLVVDADRDLLERSRSEYIVDRSIRTDDFDPASREQVTVLEVGETDEDFFDYQWDKQDQRIPEAHGTARGESTRVAIIDSGVASEHPELEGRVDVGLSKSFADDEFGIGKPFAGTHGTHVAGIVAASDETTGGVVGSAPAAELVDLRVSGVRLGSGDRSTETAKPASNHWWETFAGDVIAALVYAAEIDCDVANLSVGWTWSMREEDSGRFWGSIMQRLGNYARRNGLVHVHAAGNWGESLQFNRDETDSSEIAGGVGVAATGPVGFDPETGEYQRSPQSPTDYTTHGISAIDLAAPGGSDTDTPADGVLSAIAGPQYDEDGEYVTTDYGYGWIVGTSMAAPQVTGAAALVKSANPDANPNQIQNALTRSADHPPDYDKKYFGSGGYLDTYAALE